MNSTFTWTSFNAYYWYYCNIRCKFKREQWLPLVFTSPLVPKPKTGQQINNIEIRWKVSLLYNVYRRMNLNVCLRKILKYMIIRYQSFFEICSYFTVIKYVSRRKIALFYVVYFKRSLERLSTTLFPFTILNNFGLMNVYVFYFQVSENEKKNEHCLILYFAASDRCHGKTCFEM